MSTEAGLEHDPTVDAGEARTDGGELRRGDLVDRYVIVGTIGAGGMGRVYAAYDPDLDRRIAIKQVLDPDGRATRPRLLREAQAMARLHHANVITIHDVGVHDDQVFLAMELIDGQTLRGWLAGPGRGAAEVVKVLTAAGRGLVAAHAVGIVHRDFKPDNVLVAHDGRVVVTDFGIARVDANNDDGDGAATDADGDVVTHAPAAMTATGAIKGTPAYMAPEQHLGIATDARTDQFSFCVVLYEALYGRPPFGTGGAGEVSNLAAHALEVIEGRVRAPASGAAPGWLAPIVLRGLAADPAARWPSIAALLDALAAVPRRRRRLALGAGGIALAAAVAVLVARRPAAARTAAPCEGVASRLVGVWDDETRAAARTATLAGDRPLARTTWPLVEARLNQYAEAWTVRARAVCELGAAAGPALDAQQALRGRCLDHRLRSLDALVDALIATGDGAADRAVAAAAGLPDPAVCDQPDLIGRFQVPPDAVADEATIDRGEAEVARVRALLQLGKYADAIAIADAAVTLLGPVRYPALLADAEVVAALARAEKGEADAIGRLEAAALAADGAGHDEARFEALLSLGNALVKATRPAEAAAALRTARAALLRRGVIRPRWEALVRDAEAQLALSRDEHPTALRLRQEALAWAERVTPHDDVAIGLAHVNLGATHAQMGQLEPALTEVALGRELLVRALGAEHPRITRVLIIEGALAKGRGDIATARARTGLALERMRLAVGPDSVELLAPLYNLTIIDLDLERFDDARSEADEGLALATRIHGERSQVRARWLAALAAVHTRAGHPDLAVEPAEQALASLRAASATGTDVAYAAFVAGRARWLADDDRRRARSLVAEAIALNRAGGEAYAQSNSEIDAWRRSSGMAN